MHEPAHSPGRFRCLRVARTLPLRVGFFTKPDLEINPLECTEFISSSSAIKKQTENLEERTQGVKGERCAWETKVAQLEADCEQVRAGSCAAAMLHVAGRTSCCSCAANRWCFRMSTQVPAADKILQELRVRRDEEKRRSAEEARNIEISLQRMEKARQAAAVSHVGVGVGGHWWLHRRARHTLCCAEASR